MLALFKILRSRSGVPRMKARIIPSLRTKGRTRQNAGRMTWGHMKQRALQIIFSILFRYYFVLVGASIYCNVYYKIILKPALYVDYTIFSPQKLALARMWT